MKQAFLDSETLGLNRLTSIVTDIGVIVYDSETGQEERIGIRPDITEQLLLGKQCERDTVKFHEKHFPGGYEAFLKHLQGSDTYKNMRIAETHKLLKSTFDSVEEIWINGLSFDPIVLESMFSLVGLKLPYYYRKEVDVRTIYRRVLPRLRNMLKADEVKHPPSKHDALEDAAWNLLIFKEYQQHMQHIESIVRLSVPQMASAEEDTSNDLKP